MKNLTKLFASVITSIASVTASAQDLETQNDNDWDLDVFGNIQLINTATFSENGETNFYLPEPNFVIGARASDEEQSFTFSAGLKILEADTSNWFGETDARLQWATLSYKNDGTTVTAGMLPPAYIFSTYAPVQYNDGFSLPSLRNMNVLRGGVTGIGVQQVFSLDTDTNLILKGGAGWRFEDINYRFGNESGPGYGNAPSFFGGGIVTHDLSEDTSIRFGAEFLYFGEGDNGIDLTDQHYFFQLDKDFGDVSASLLFETLGTEIGDNGTDWSSNIIGQFTVHATDDLDVRFAAGLIDEDVSADAQLIYDLGDGWSVMGGEGYNFDTGATTLTGGLRLEF